MTQLSNVIQQAQSSVNKQGIPINCKLGFNLFLCNFAFLPCNLTTGIPNPVCLKSCLYFHQNCPIQYDLVQAIAISWNFSVAEDCNYVSTHLELEISSNDFNEDCLDFGVESMCIVCLIPFIVKLYI